MLALDTRTLKPLVFDNSPVEGYAVIVNEHNVAQFTGKMAVIIYHRKSRKYFSSITNNPQEYYRNFLDAMNLRPYRLPAVLQPLLKDNKEVDVCMMHLPSRTPIERWLASKGYSRIATPKGSLVAEDLVIYRVTDNSNGFQRFVSFPGQTDREKVIEEANTSMLTWIAFDKCLGLDEQERKHMQTALRSRYEATKWVLEPASAVVAIEITVPRRYVTKVPVMVRDYNKQAINEFMARASSFNYHPSIRR